MHVQRVQPLQPAAKYMTARFIVQSETSHMTLLHTNHKEWLLYGTGVPGSVPPHHAALTAVTCRYEDVLKPQDIYSLVGLTAFYNGFFGQCSQAFTRLEGLSSLSEVLLDGKHQHMHTHTAMS